MESRLFKKLTGLKVTNESQQTHQPYAAVVCRQVCILNGGQ